MAANVNNYIAAGNSAVKNTLASLAATRDNAPKYDEIAKEGLRARTKEKIAAMKADMNVENAKIKAETELKVDKIVSDAKTSIKKSNRKTKFAGKIAAAGAAIATSLLPSAEIIKPSQRDFSPERDKLQGNLESSKAEVDKWKSMPDADSSVPANAIYQPSGDSPAPTAGATLNTTDGWGRMSRAIRFAEGTSGDRGYTTMFGGGQFSDMSRHPDTVVHTDRYSSAAAGAYQFMPGTWAGAQSALNLPDFSRESQEKAGRYLTEQRGVDPDAVYTTKEEFGRAIDRLAPEWAGLPTLATGTSYYGQGGKSLDQLWSVYNQ